MLASAAPLALALAELERGAEVTWLKPDGREVIVIAAASDVVWAVVAGRDVDVVDCNGG